MYYNGHKIQFLSLMPFKLYKFTYEENHLILKNIWCIRFREILYTEPRFVIIEFPIIFHLPPFPCNFFTAFSLQFKKNNGQRIKHFQLEICTHRVQTSTRPEDQSILSPMCENLRLS